METVISSVFESASEKNVSRNDEIYDAKSKLKLTLFRVFIKAQREKCIEK